MAAARVLVLSGSQVGREVAFTDDLLIGRSEQAGLPLADTTVSRSHARVCFRGGRWLLVDLKSSNGTRLAGHPVTKAELAGGAEFQVGEVSLRFQVEAEEEAALPAAPGGVGADGGDEIELEEGEEEAFPVPAPPPPAAATPKPTPGAAGRPTGAAKAPLAAPGTMRRLGGEEVETGGGGGGLLGGDLGQWSGPVRLLGIFFALALCAGVGYLFYLLATGF